MDDLPVRSQSKFIHSHPYVVGVSGDIDVKETSKWLEENMGPSVYGLPREWNRETRLGTARWQYDWFETLNGDWEAAYRFKNAQDAVLFKLVWS